MRELLKRNVGDKTGGEVAILTQTLELLSAKGAQLMANVVLAGLALLMLGSFLLLIASDLEKSSLH